MAVCRCRKCGPPKGLVQDHPHRHDVAKIEPTVFCACSSCLNPAVIWLTEEEEERYRLGARTFTCGRRKDVVLD